MMALAEILAYAPRVQLERQKYAAECQNWTPELSGWYFMTAAVF